MMGKKSKVKKCNNQEFKVVNGGLDIVSPENFQRMKDSLNGCEGCVREQAKTRVSDWRRTVAPKYKAKANTPIVIKLEDTLCNKAASRKDPIPQVDDSTEETISAEETELSELKRHDSLYKQDINTYALMRLCKSKDGKNLSCLLNAMEREHRKDETHSAQNLNCPQNALNNRADRRLDRRKFSPNFKNCKNVHLIRNNLYSHEGLVETTDTESIISGSSDFDSGVSVEDELTREESDQLVDYTTGVPFVRYRMPTWECPECLSAWYTASANMWLSTTRGITSDELFGHSQHDGVYTDVQGQSSHDSDVSQPGSPGVETSDVRSQRRGSESVDAGLGSGSSDSECDSKPKSNTTPLNHLSKEFIPSYLLPKPEAQGPSQSIEQAPVTTIIENDDVLAVQSADSQNIFDDGTTATVDQSLQSFHLSIDDDQESLSNSSYTRASSESANYTRASSESASYTRASSESDDGSRLSESPLSTFTDTCSDCTESEVDAPHGANTDSVYVDLTDTGIKFTVYYQDSDLTDAEKTVSSSGCSGYMYYPYLGLYVPYSPFLAQYMQPVYVPEYAVPRPLYSYNPWGDTDLPKEARVPPHALKKFNATHPPQRPWIPLGHPERGKPTALFTVMCYNVLCDKYATRQIYGYCPSWALNWEYRKKAILDEVRHYSADIISLQEVETDQFYNFFLPELTRDGYHGIFSPKSRARTMANEQDRKHVDGCAIFFRTSKFVLVKEHLVEFNQLAIANAEGSDDMLNRVMTKDNIGLAALLETKDTVYENGVPPENQARQHLLVTTAHIHWDPQFCDVKLVQTMMLMAELKSIIEEMSVSLRPGSSQKDENSIPMIFCGDLNSLPESGVIEYLTNGKISIKHEDFKEMAYADTLQKLSTSDSGERLTHNFRLDMAYKEDVMPYTNYTFDFKGIIDYIFYSKDFIKPMGLLGPLDTEWFKENKILGAPHPHIPSDHFALLAEFELDPFLQKNNSILSSGGHSALR